MGHGRKVVWARLDSRGEVVVSGVLNSEELSAAQ